MPNAVNSSRFWWLWLSLLDLKPAHLDQQMTLSGVVDCHADLSCRLDIYSLSGQLKLFQATIGQLALYWSQHGHFWHVSLTITPYLLPHMLLEGSGCLVW